MDFARWALKSSAENKQQYLCRIYPPRASARDSPSGILNGLQRQHLIVIACRLILIRWDYTKQRFW